MKCNEIIESLEKRYPPFFAMSWDNVGLLVGRKDKEVKKILIAVDAVDSIIEQAVSENVDLLITHHPLIFSGMKKITDEDFIGRRIVKLLQNDINYYAMHTNYDVMGMADRAGEMLSFKDREVLDETAETEQKEGIGRITTLEQAITVKDCCELVKERFHLENVKVYGDLSKEVRRIAISPGSGKGMVSGAIEKAVEVLITGDIDHHTGIDAVARGMAIIDAGHYGIEHIFIEDVADYLQKNVAAVEIIKEKVHHPFQVV